MGLFDNATRQFRLSWGEALLQLVVLACWLAAFAAAALLEYAPNASLWFPPAAVTFAAVLVLGPRVAPVVVLACIVATVLSDRVYGVGLDWPGLLVSGLAFALAHTLAYGAVAMLLRQGAIQASPVTTLRKVSWFLLSGAAASGLAAALGALSLGLTGMTGLGAVLALIAPWWIGDYAGLISVAPLFGLLLSRLAERLGVGTPQGTRRLLGRAPWKKLFPGPALKLAVLLGLTLAVLTADAIFPGQEALLFLLFIPLVVQLWIVHTEGELAALLGIFAFSVVLAAGAGLMDLGHQALMLQFVLIALAVSSHLGLAVPALYRDNHRMRRLLTHDSLTGALTRSFFEDRARESIRKSVELQRPACLVMVDLDRLKAINDTRGHAAGDLALKPLVRACSRSLAPGQLLGRLSGDEFALLLPDCGRAATERVIAAIQSDLAASPPVAGSERATASFGVAELDPDKDDYDRLLARADRAMYREKRG